MSLCPGLNSMVDGLLARSVSHGLNAVCSRTVEARVTAPGAVARTAVESSGEHRAIHGTGPWLALRVVNSGLIKCVCGLSLIHI